MISGVDRYYEILGLWPGASLDEVRRAYRELVQVWHPDRFTHNPELRHRAEEKLKVINDSYSRIKSRQKSPGERTRKRNTESQSAAATKKRASQQEKKGLRVNPKTALVVDSEAESRMALREFFARKGFRVVEVQDDNEAIPAYVLGKPDMVFLGTRKHGQANLETLRRIKTINPEAAIIVASGRETTKAYEPQQVRGAYYINKPINFNYLGQAIQGELGSNGGIVNITI
jgi:CheY-like chemotaxis protein